MCWPSLHDAVSIGEAHVKLIVESSRDPAPPASFNHERLWGPILGETARCCGALVAASSVLIRPTKIEYGNMRRVLDLLPDALTPKMSDTPEELTKRLSECEWLDPIHTAAKGNAMGGRYVWLNETAYPQPRRKSWSLTVETDMSSVALGNRQSVHLLCYVHLYRQSVLEYHCSPMPMPVFNLGVELWKTAWPYMTKVSQKQPMNHCELLCYYTLFKGSMGRHRDNFNAKDLRSYLETGKDPQPGSRNVQVADSNVLIWSMGNAPMMMSLSFPPKDGDPGERKRYIVHPIFQFELQAGTLFVFAPLDDLFFCHETEFVKRVLDAAGAAGHRFAFVYRWLKQETAQRFDAATGKLYPLPKMLAELEQKKKDLNVTKSRKRRSDVGL
jgi:hypothetical protein